MTGGTIAERDEREDGARGAHPDPSAGADPASSARARRTVQRTIVTGASAGLGHAIAAQLLAAGRLVTGIDRDPAPEAFRAASEEGRDGPNGPRYRHERADLSSPAETDALVARLLTPLAPLSPLPHPEGRAPTAREAAMAGGPPGYDLVVMAAGISATGRFEAIPATAHGALLRVNAEAPLVMADALIAAGALHGDGTLVLVSSLSVDVGYPGAASYAASKDALHAYGRSLNAARRKAKGGLRPPRVLTVLPGPLRTEHAARHAPEGSGEAKRMVPGQCAALILRAVRARRTGVLRPGAGAGLAGAFGRLLPGPSARLMRRVLFDRLDREVW